MLHSYVAGPFVTRQSKLVFSDSTHDLATYSSIGPAEALAAVVNPADQLDIDAICKKYRVEAVNCGVGFDADRLDDFGIELLRRISERFGWVIVKYPLPQEIFDLAKVESNANAKEERRKRYRESRIEKNN